MLHMILLILKWIGLILGGIIGFLLLLFLLVLFVPLRYRMRMASGEEGISGRIQADWLMRAFGVIADYRDGKPRVRLKLFWLPLFTLYPRKESTEKKRSKRHSGTASENRPASSGDEGPEVAEHRRLEQELEQELLEERGQRMDLLPEQPRIEHQAQEIRSAERPRVSLPYRIVTGLFRLVKKLVLTVWRLFRTLLRLPFLIVGTVHRFFQKLGYTIRKIYVKICRKRESVRELMAFLRQEETQAALSKCKQQLLKMLHHAAPRKIRGQFTAGTGDPALTGQLYGLYCMACPVHKFQVQIQPDFDNAVFQGKVSLRGRIRLAAMLFYGFRILADANVRNLIRRVRNR